MGDMHGNRKKISTLCTVKYSLGEVLVSDKALVWEGKSKSLILTSSLSNSVCGKLHT